MHIVLGLLTTIVTLLILLNRLAEAGISLGGLNPFLLHRRRKWQQQLEGNPIYHVESPMDATALLMVATARLDGDMSAGDKATIIEGFTDELNLSKREAAALLVSSTYLHGRGDELRANLDRILQPSLPNFTEEQARSAIALLDGLCGPGVSSHELKREFVDDVGERLQAPFAPKGKWT